MKKIILGLLAIVMFIGCSDTSQGDTYNVAVTNAGDGDVVVTTGAGVVTLGKNDTCVVLLDTNLTRPCTQREYDDAYGKAAAV